MPTSLATRMSLKIKWKTKALNSFTPNKDNK